MNCGRFFPSSNSQDEESAGGLSKGWECMMMIHGLLTSPDLYLN